LCYDGAEFQPLRYTAGFPDCRMNERHSMVAVRDMSHCMAALYGSMRATHMFMVPSKSQREKKGAAGPVRAGSTVLTLTRRHGCNLSQGGWAHGLHPS
jgi:hypothetical protein